MRQCRVIRSLTDHGTCHQKVDDACIRGSCRNLHQRIRLRGQRCIIEAVLLRSILTCRACLHGKGQILHAVDILVSICFVRGKNHNLCIVAVSIGACHRGRHLIGQCHAVPDHIDALVLELQNLVVPVDLHELYLYTKILRNLLRHIGVKADPFAALILIVHRLEIGDSDDQTSLILDVLHIAVGRALLASAAGQHSCSHQSGQHYSQYSFLHNNHPPRRSCGISGCFSVLLPHFNWLSLYHRKVSDATCFPGK